ncbi:MAG: ABC transporter permease [Phycisphaeraceae bacterium]
MTMTTTTTPTDLESLPFPAAAAPAPTLSTDEGDAAEPREQVIRATHGWVGLDWSELLHFRELLFFLVWRDFKVRYKQTVLGVAWAVLVPVVQMLIFTVIFGTFLKMQSEGYPYAVFVYAGLLPWTFFSTGVNLAGLSLVNQAHVLTKIYFPRLFVPTASVGAGLVDLVISFAVYAIILLCYQQPISGQIVFLPLLIVLTVMATLGVGYILAALTVNYRDFRYVIPFMLQALMYASPVIFPVSVVPQKYQWILALNPMAGIIDGFRAAILPGKPWNFTTLGVSTAMTLLLFVLGVFYFRRVERKFADIA